MRVDLMENVPSTGGETLADAELQVMVSKIGRLVIDNDLHQPGLDRQWQAEANRTRHSPKAKYQYRLRQSSLSALTCPPYCLRDVQEWSSPNKMAGSSDLC